MALERRGLAPRQAAFVREYLVDLNGTKAAIRAGYAAKTARFQAAALLTKHNIQKVLELAMAARAARTEVLADRVVRELARIAFSDLGDYMSWDAGGHIRVRPSAELTEAQSAAIASVTTTRTRSPSGDRGPRVVSVKLHDKLAALDLLGRHLGLFVGQRATTVRHLDAVLRAVWQLLNRYLPPDVIQEAIVELGRLTEKEVCALAATTTARSDSIGELGV